MGFSVKGLFGKEKWDFRVLLDVSSPRHTSVHLGKGVNLPLKIASIHRNREGPPRHRGPPRRGQLRLGEPGNMECGLCSPPRRGVSHLGEPLFLGKGGLRLSVLVTT